MVNEQQMVDWITAFALKIYLSSMTKQLKTGCYKRFEF